MLQQGHKDDSPRWDSDAVSEKQWPSQNQGLTPSVRFTDDIYRGLQPLSYAEARRIVEFDLNGDVRRVLLEQAIPLLSTGDRSQTDSQAGLTPRSRPKPRGRGRKSTGNKRPKLEAKATVPLPVPVIQEVQPPSLAQVEPRSTYYRYIEKNPDELDEEVEYGIDEEDCFWLAMINDTRKSDGVPTVNQETFEYVMDRLEKESHFERQTVDGMPYNMVDEDAVCCICGDGEGTNSNVILFCDVCDMAVHQDCYGVPYIPEGSWNCRKCMKSPSCPVKCILCPNQSGAFKQTDDGRWAHVACALWIPEVGFSNLVFLEPIDSVSKIPAARWKLTCSVCKRKEGACIQCCKGNCYSAFHVTCAQQAGYYMRLVPRQSGSSSGGGEASVKQLAYCDFHTEIKKMEIGEEGLKDDDTKDSVSSPCPVVNHKRLPALPTSNDEDATSRSSQKRHSSSQNNRKSKVESEAVFPNIDRRSKSLGRVLEPSHPVKSQPPKEERGKMPVVHVPSIPPTRLNKIVSGITIAKKTLFVEQVTRYWMLKRQSRNGVPLLRRLQACVGIGRSKESDTNHEIEELNDVLQVWRALRHDLERARLLVELVRKREKLKREQYKLEHRLSQLRLQPITLLLRSAWSQVKAKDQRDVFARPVTEEEAPDYHQYIKDPTDLSTISSKIDGQHYTGFDDFEAEVLLMINNCLTYNKPDTVFYKAGVKFGDMVRPVLNNFRSLCEDVMNEVQARFAGTDCDPVTRNTGDSVTTSACKKDTVKSSAALRQPAAAEPVDPAATRRRPGRKPGRPPKRMSSLQVDTPSKSTQLPNGDTDSMDIHHKIRFSHPLSNSDNEAGGVGPTPFITASKGRESPCAEREHGNFNGNFCTDVDMSPEKDTSPTVVALSAPKSSKSTVPLYDSTTASLDAVSGNMETCATNNLAHETSTAGRQPVVTDSEAFGDGACADVLNGRRTHRPSVLNGVCMHIGPPAFHGGSSPATAEAAENQQQSDSHDFRLSTDSDSVCFFLAEDQRSGSSSQRRGSCHSDSMPCSPTYVVDMEMQLSPACARDGDTGMQSAGLLTVVEPTQGDADGPSAWPSGCSPDKVKPLTMVWAKCCGYPFYPAMVTDPNSQYPQCLANLNIPVPSTEVLQLRRSPSAANLVVFFDNKRSWQWVSRNKLHPLGEDSSTDRDFLTNIRTPNMKNSIKQAYERANRFHRQLQERLAQWGQKTEAAAEASP